MPFPKDKIMKGAYSVPYKELSLVEKVRYHQDKGTLIEFIQNIIDGKEMKSVG